jgi:hypothetical protein
VVGRQFNGVKGEESTTLQFLDSTGRGAHSAMAAARKPRGGGGELSKGGR